MFYISKQVSRKLLTKTRQMECSGTLPQPAPVEPGISPTLFLTNANSLTLEQICKELGISETELDHCMPLLSAQDQANFLQTPESRPRKAAACPNKTRIKAKTKVVKPIFKRINALKISTWAVLEAESARLVGKKPKRSCKSDDVVDGDRRDVDERTRRDLDKSDNE